MECYVTVFNHPKKEDTKFIMKSIGQIKIRDTSISQQETFSYVGVTNDIEILENPNAPSKLVHIIIEVCGNSKF